MENFIAINLCVLESQNHQKWFETHNLKLYPKHEILQTMFTRELVLN
jgi:hypothetical protein